MSESEARGVSTIARPVLIGLFVSGVTVLTASFVAALLLMIGLNWAHYMHTVSLTIAFAAVALGGVFAGMRSKSRGWLAGILTGAFFTLICYLICLLGGIRQMMFSLAAVRFLTAAGTGAVAGMLGANLRSS